jgi:hypothetical protein
VLYTIKLPLAGMGEHLFYILAPKRLEPASEAHKWLGRIAKHHAAPGAPAAWLQSNTNSANGPSSRTLVTGSRSEVMVFLVCLGFFLLCISNVLAIVNFLHTCLSFYTSVSLFLLLRVAYAFLHLPVSALKNVCLPPLELAIASLLVVLGA